MPYDERRLTADELARYRRDGFVGPLRGWEEDEIERRVARLLARLEQRGLMNDRWVRVNLHATVPDVAEIAACRAVVDRLASILGPDVMLFESSVFISTPTRPGPDWHAHTYPDWRPQPSTHCVVRIALTAEPEGHCHRFVPACALALDWNGVGPMPWQDAWSEGAVSVPLRAGELVLFDGALAHCAGDRVDGRTAPERRASLVLRAATPAQHVGVRADTGQCVMLCGRDDHGLNRCGALASGATHG